MRVRTVGAGAPIALVHGLAGSSRWWRRVAPALAAEHTIHLLDLPRWRAYDPDDLVDRIAERFSGLGGATFVGHSLGGLLSIRLAARHPQVVSRLVLVAPAGIPGYSAARSIRPLASALLRSRPSFLPRLVLDTVRGGPLSVLVAGLRLLADDVRPDLGAVQVPTLLLWGDRDPLLPPDHAKEFLAALRDARLELVPGAAHVPMLERPDEVSRSILEFLRQGDGSPARPRAGASSGPRDRRPRP